MLSEEGESILTPFPFIKFDKKKNILEILLKL